MIAVVSSTAPKYPSVAAGLTGLQLVALIENTPLDIKK